MGGGSFFGSALLNIPVALVATAAPSPTNTATTNANIVLARIVVASLLLMRNWECGMRNEKLIVCYSAFPIPHSAFALLFPPHHCSGHQFLVAMAVANETQKIRHGMSGWQMQPDRHRFSGRNCLPRWNVRS